MAQMNQKIEQYPPYDGGHALILRRFSRTHPGLDTSGQWNQPVCALFPGRVMAARFDPQWGMVCEYRSPNGRVTVSYRHLTSVAVNVGRTLRTGETIGTEGATGMLAQGRRQLHTGLWIDAKPADPLPYLTGERLLPVTLWEGGLGMMSHQIGDTVRVTGGIFPDAWGSGASQPGNGKEYTITKIHLGPGRRKPYQLGASGFVGEEDLFGRGEQTVPKWEYDRLRAENDSLRAQLEGFHASAMGGTSARKG